MCFSATSSFAASGMLASIGIIGLLSVRRVSAYPRALIPFGFAFQQLCEGIVWMVYGMPAYTSLLQFSTIGFLLFALIVWPIWVPLSFMVSEKNRSKQLLLAGIFFLGCVFGFSVSDWLYSYPVGVRITCHSLAYTYGNLSGIWQYIAMLVYVCTTVVPFFVSTLVGARVMGILITAGLVISWWSFYATFGSVWCFFAALISSLIVVQLKLEQ